MSSTIGLRTTMTWEQAEDLTKKDPHILPSVHRALVQSRFGSSLDLKVPSWVYAFPLVILSFGIMACALSLDGIIDPVVGVIGIGCTSIVISLILSVINEACWLHGKRRQILQQNSLHIEQDKMNPNRPMLAGLLAQDLKLEKATLTATTNRIKNIQDALPVNSEKV